MPALDAARERVTVAAAAMPEPGTLALALVAGFDVAAARRRRAACCAASRGGISSRNALECAGICHSVRQSPEI